MAEVDPAFYTQIEQSGHQLAYPISHNRQSSYLHDSTTRFDRYIFSNFELSGRLCFWAPGSRTQLAFFKVINLEVSILIIRHIRTTITTKIEAVRVRNNIPHVRGVAGVALLLGSL